MPKNINIELDVDTKELTLKLRCIAKHFVSLADELESINGKRKCPKCSSTAYGIHYDGLYKIKLCFDCGLNEKSEC